VGDSLEHDVLGAARVGLASAFVAGGIHARDLGIAWGESPQPAAWRAFLDAAPARPGYLLATFTW
jgi:ribonucleotide monophosphatase NagD (HAD superfamily)